MTTMKAAVLRQFGQPLSIEAVPMPTAKHGEVLVKIMACGACHSDLHMMRQELDPPKQPPLILGHEGTGVVAEVGPGVEHLKNGDRVGMALLAEACCMCDYCTIAEETSCFAVKWKGFSEDGYYAEFVAVNAKFVYRLPDNLGFAECAPLFCAGVTTYRAVLNTGARTGQWLAVLGIGGLGHLAIQFAKAMGIRVVAVDVRPESLELAKQLGADIVVNAAAEDPVVKIHEQLHGVHAAVVTSTSSKSFAQAVAMLRKCGVAVFVGLPKEPEAVINIHDLALSKKVIRGTLVGSRADAKEVLELAAAGKVKVIFSTAPLDKINEVLTLLQEGKVNGRIVVTMA